MLGSGKTGRNAAWLEGSGYSTRNSFGDSGDVGTEERKKVGGRKK